MQKLLTGISGGTDSIKLWVLLNQFNKLGGEIFGILICNHLWQHSNFRISEEIARLSFCDQKCYHLAITKVHLNTEQTARHWRWKVYRRLQKLKNYEKLALGHQINDWIETFFIYLFRGGQSFKN